VCVHFKISKGASSQVQDGAAVSAERGEKRAFAWKQVWIQLFFWIMIVKDFIKDKSVGWLRLVGSIKL